MASSSTTRIAPEHDETARLQAVLRKQQAAFSAEGPVTLATRIDRINRLIRLTAENGTAIVEALRADFGGARSSHVTMMTEIVSKVQGMEHARDHLAAWMTPESRQTNAPFNSLGATSEVIFQPKGVVGIISPWNMAFGLAVAPLTSVLAAGNRAMIKPSEFTAQTSALFVELFGRYFDDSEVAVIVGGADVGAAFARLPLDHLIFTGSTTVGRHIMRAAAENLVPVTLELGGKSPVIVGKSASFAKTATSLAFGKMMNGGQLCLSPDYALVPRGREHEFVDAFAGEIRSMYPSVVDNPDFTGVFNDAHFARLAGYIEDARKKGARVTIVNPIEHPEQQASRRMPVHILQDVTEDMDVMQDEIFGPLFPVLSYDDIADAVSFIGRRAKPLGLYYFGEDKKEETFVLENTQSGGVTVNDVLLHYAQEDLPFGGIGPSGMGAYHGYDGFLTFSHARAVFRQGEQATHGALRPPFTPELLQHFQSELLQRVTPKPVSN
jgi:coniferyl-aldehyde dehydrogenase